MRLFNFNLSLSFKFYWTLVKGYQKHFRERAVYYTTYPISEQGRNEHDAYLKKKAEGYDIDSVCNDCGRMIYDRESQDVHGGGSGCGCSAVVLSADILPKIKRGELSRILFLATGAMMSPDSLKQGEKVLAVAHLLEIERE